MQSTTPVSPDLAQHVPYPFSPWQISDSLFKNVQSAPSSQPYRKYEVLGTDPEARFVVEYFCKSAPAKLGIRRIWVIHNPNQTSLFEAAIKTISDEAKQPFYAPNWRNEPRADKRKPVHKRWKEMAKNFSPVQVAGKERLDRYDDAKVFPLWHGAKTQECNSICSAGFSSLGKHHFTDNNAPKGKFASTDRGYFGSGIYFTDSADYASMYNGGNLLMTWVTMREPYPVYSDLANSKQCTDMKTLEGKEHFQNYNAHFIPVKRAAGLKHYPCAEGQVPVWDEFVVFNKAQTLPRFWVELGVNLPKNPFINLIQVVPQGLLQIASQATNNEPLPIVPQFVGVKSLQTDASGQITAIKITSEAFKYGDLETILGIYPHVTSIDLSKTEIINADIDILVARKSLQKLDLAHCDKLTIRGIKKLKSLPKLRSLDLHEISNITQGLDELFSQFSGLIKWPRIQITRATGNTVEGIAFTEGADLSKAMPVIPGLYPHLISVSLYGIDCLDWDPHMEHIGKLTQLKHLKLESCFKITDTGAFHLSSLSQLQYLNLSESGDLTDTGLQHLSSLSQLQYLNLHEGVSLTNTGLQHLSSLSQLQFLDLGFCCDLITDAGLIHLSSLSQLRSLSLYRADKITGAGLQHLSSLSQLQFLDVRASRKLTHKGVQFLEKALGSAVVFSDWR